MKLVALSDDLHEYLVHVVKAYCASGLETKELTPASELWKRVAGAQEVDFSQLGKVNLESFEPGKSIALSVVGDQTTEKADDHS